MCAEKKEAKRVGDNEARSRRGRLLRWCERRPFAFGFASLLLSKNSLPNKFVSTTRATRSLNLTQLNGGAFFEYDPSCSSQFAYDLDGRVLCKGNGFSFISTFTHKSNKQSVFHSSSGALKLGSHSNR